MASPLPRIHGFGELSESFRLVDNEKNCEFDAYLVLTCRVENRRPAEGEGLVGLGRAIEATAQFFPGRQYPHPGAKPRAVQCCGTMLTIEGGPPWALARTTEPLVLPFDARLTWEVKADDGVPAWAGEAPGFPEPYVWTQWPAEVPVAATFELEAVVERAVVGGGGLPPADRLALSITHHMPGESRPRPGHAMRLIYPGPIDGDMYVLASRLEKSQDDRPPYFAPGSGSAVARAIRYGEAAIKVPGGVDQRWRLMSVVEAEVPLTWVA